MTESVFDLDTIALGRAEPVGGNRLVVGEQQVATAKRGLVGSSTRVVRERSTINQVWQGRVAEIIDLDDLGIEPQRAVSAAGADHPDRTFLVIAFDDGAFDDVHWVLQGAAADVGAAAAALSAPAGGTTGVASSAPAPVRRTSKPLLVIVAAGLAVIGVLAAAIAVFLSSAG